MRSNMSGTTVRSSTTGDVHISRCAARRQKLRDGRFCILWLGGYVVRDGLTKLLRQRFRFSSSSGLFAAAAAARSAISLETNVS